MTADTLIRAPLSWRQRGWNLFARWVEKPLIAGVVSQPLLRRVAALHAALFYKRTRDMRFEAVELRHGAARLPALWCDRGRTPLPAVILYLHGGAYTVGGTASHRHWAAQLADACGCRALLPVYRLAPEHPFPAALDDAETAYRSLLDGPARGAPIVLMGDSAGGGLAFALAARVQAAGLRAPAALVGFSPWVDLTLSGRSFSANAARELMLPATWLRRSARQYGGAAPGGCANPGVSPLFHRYLGALPPTLILCGSGERLLDDSVRMARHLRNAGTEVQLHCVEGVSHIWPVRAGLTDEADAANDRVAAFVRATLAPSAHAPTTHPMGVAPCT